ncbi:hypothetical protein ACIBL3_33950 [Kribbella sp. NPDC050124]|uniref:hypothetical protein n=1 Tax=Kribbella sp. NPDC050124 TaxID=3364114 RepID=UPI00379377AC
MPEVVIAGHDLGRAGHQIDAVRWVPHVPYRPSGGRRWALSTYGFATEGALAQILEVTDDSMAARASEDRPDRDALQAVRHACQLSYAKLSSVAGPELNDVAFGVLNYVEEAYGWQLLALSTAGEN